MRDTSLYSEEEQEGQMRSIREEFSLITGEVTSSAGIYAIGKYD
jgi:hypothetical protein